MKNCERWKNPFKQAGQWQTTEFKNFYTSLRKSWRKDAYVILAESLTFSVHNLNPFMANLQLKREKKVNRSSVVYCRVEVFCFVYVYHKTYSRVLISFSVIISIQKVVAVKCGALAVRFGLDHVKINLETEGNQNFFWDAKASSSFRSNWEVTRFVAVGNSILKFKCVVPTQKGTKEYEWSRGYLPRFVT